MTNTPTSGASARQREMQAESDAAREIIANGCGCHRECEQNGRDVCGCREDGEAIIALAARAVSIPDAGADDVELVAQAIYLHMFPERDENDWRAEAERDGGRLRSAYLSCARRALAVMPRRDERAGMMLRAAALEVVRAFERGIEENDRRDPVEIDVEVLTALMAAVVAFDDCTSTGQVEQDGWREILSEPIWTAGAVKELVEALEWYGENARLCRLIHSEGDPGRHALSDDGGKRAGEALSAFKRLPEASKTDEAELQTIAEEAWHDGFNGSPSRSGEYPEGDKRGAYNGGFFAGWLKAHPDAYLGPAPETKP